MSDATPWLKLKTESAASYALFLRYRDAGPRRTLEMLAAGTDLPQPDASKCSPDVVQDPALPKISSLKALSRRNKWVARAESWDAHIQAVRDQVREQNARQREEWELTRQRELWEASQKVSNKALMAIDLPLIERTRKTVVKAYEDGRPHTTQIDILRPIRCTLKDAVLALRLAYELRDEATGHRTTPQDGPAVDSSRGPMFVEVEEVRRDDGPIAEAPEVRRDDGPIAEAPGEGK